MNLLQRLPAGLAVPLLAALSTQIAVAQSSAPASSPAKKELIAKIVQLHAPMADNLAQSIVQQPMGQLTQAGRMALQQVPAEKRESVAKAMDADVKKFIEENVAYVKDKASKAVPATATTFLDERFNEDELRQILTWAESPVSKKFGLYNAELVKALNEKLLAESGPTLEGRFKTLQANLGKHLGLPPAGSAPASAASAAKPAPAKK